MIELHLRCKMIELHLKCKMTELHLQYQLINNGEGSVGVQTSRRFIQE